MSIYSEHEAYKLYCGYAIRKGFDVRKGNIRYSAIDKSVIKQCDYLWSCYETYNDNNPSEPKKIRRMIQRIGCKAYIWFTVNNGVWKVTQFHKEHNHEFVKSELRWYWKINRHIDVANASVISSMIDVGIGGTKAYFYWSKELGDVKSVPFTKWDCQNFVHRRKINLIEADDVQILITQFNHCLAKDPMFYHSKTLDKDGRLANFFLEGWDFKLGLWLLWRCCCIWYNLWNKQI